MRRQTDSTPLPLYSRLDKVKSNSSRKWLPVICLLICLSLAVFIFLFRRPYITDVGYLTRPLWDRPEPEWNVIDHFFSDEMQMEQKCQLHKWTVRDKPARVVDAVIFSVELDLLEVRIRELMDVVDVFVIVESNTTFTGKLKPTVFHDNRERFNFIPESRIISHITELPPLPPGGDPFLNEGRMRGAMQRLLNRSAFKIGLKEGDLINMGDTDEIPRRATLELLKNCEGYPKSLALQLRQYLYSFDFFYDFGDVRAHVDTWNGGGMAYDRARGSRMTLLADAGWHCSFCFRRIADFQFKMRSYSHNDRVRYPSLLEHDRIQRVICEGEDIFGMLPEAYSFRELISKWGKIPRVHSTLGLPKYLMENPQKFEYLLPGGCQREA